MTRLWRLLASLLVWVVMFPLVNAGLAWLSRNHHDWAVSLPMLYSVVVAFLLWAIAIYWFQVPSTTRVGTRALYLIAYVAATFIAGLCALWLAFVLHVALFGL